MEYDLDVKDIARRYLAGETEQSIAKSLSVSRSVIKRRILSVGVRRRGNSEARVLMWQRIQSPADRMRIVSAAHDAIRGKRQSLEHRTKTAKTREIKKSSIGRGEILLADMLEKVGLNVTLQKAIGPYNVDIAVHEGSLAVEIFGGNWHNSFSHARRFRERCDYLLDCGWLPVIIWVTKHFPLEKRAVDYLVALSQRQGFGKTIRREEHVIRGDGSRSKSGHNPINGTMIRP